MKRKQPFSRDILPIMNEEALCQVTTQRCVLFGQQSIVNKSRVIGLSGRSIAVYKHGRPETVNQQSVAQICTQRNGPLLCVRDRDAQPSARIHACGPRSVRQGASPVAATLACGRKATLVPRKGRPMQHLFSAATPTPQPKSLFWNLLHSPQRPWRPPWWRVGGGRRAPVPSRCPKSPRSPPRGRPGCSRPPGRSCPCRPACTRSHSQLYSPCADAPLATHTLTHTAAAYTPRATPRPRRQPLILPPKRQLCNRCRTPARQKAYLTQSRRYNGLKFVTPPRKYHHFFHLRGCFVFKTHKFPFWWFFFILKEK